MSCDCHMTQAVCCIWRCVLPAEVHWIVTSIKCGEQDGWNYLLHWPENCLLVRLLYIAVKPPANHFPRPFTRYVVTSAALLKDTIDFQESLRYLT